MVQDSVLVVACDDFVYYHWYRLESRMTIVVVTVCDCIEHAPSAVRSVEPEQNLYVLLRIPASLYE